MSAMRSIGGRRPVEIAPHCQETDNADLVFDSENVVVEIKTLLEDPRERQGAGKKLGEMYNKWVDDGKVPNQLGVIKISTADLPQDCAREFMFYITRRIKSVVRKGNKQIRVLKSNLNMPDAKGLLVLCNSGNAFLRPDVVFWGLHHALGQRHSSIDWVIYMTCGLPVQLPGLPEPVDLFTQPTRQGYEAMPSELFSRIKDAWMSYVAGDGYTRAYIGNDPNILRGVEHNRTRRRFR